MRWGRLIKDIEHWFDTKIVPLLGDDRISLQKVKEEYKELKEAEEDYWNIVASPKLTINRTRAIRTAQQHREAEAADLMVALICYCHANDINLKRAVYATLLKLQKRKWARTAVPGLVRHVD